MDQKELVKKMKALNSMLEDFLDNMDMAEVDCKAPQKAKDKEDK